jgi:hypothetical protein
MVGIPTLYGILKYQIASTQSIKVQTKLDVICVVNSSLMTINILGDKPPIEIIHEIKQELENKNSPLRQEYLLDVDGEAIDLLQHQSHLISTLLQLLPIVADSFKGDRLYLTVIKDPENCTLDKFAIIVNTRLTSGTAFTKLNELDDRCFHAGIPNDILFHVEFS